MIRYTDDDTDILSAIGMLASVDNELAADASYDVLADEYYDARHITSRNFDAATRAYFSSGAVRLPDAGLILDLGAGRGRISEYCDVGAERIVQVDLSFKMLTAQPREPATGRVMSDARRLPFLSASFAAVAAFLFDPYNTPQLFGEIARVLAPGGVFIGTLPAFEWGVALRGRSLNEADRAVFVLNNGRSLARFSHLLPRGEIVKSLENAGFKLVTAEPLTLPSDIHRVSPDIETPALRLHTSVFALPVVDIFAGIKR